MPLDRVIEPSVPPLHALDLQVHVRQDITIENAQLDYWIRSARAFAENKCRRTLIATRYKLTLDAFPQSGSLISAGVPFSLPESAILLERGPVLAVRSIKYMDMTGVQQTLPATEYVVETSGQIGRITPRFGKIWPANTLPQIGAVEILYDAGDAAGVAADATTDVVRILGGLWKTLTVGDAVRFTNSGGALPTPLTVDTDYYILTLPTSTSFTLATTPGGAQIDITAAGTGYSYLGAVPEGVGSWMKLRVGSLYDNRQEAGISNRGLMVEVPYADSLLDEYTVRLY
jgi:uncharacterized phiE125 gp8 family phage protein